MKKSLLIIKVCISVYYYSNKGKEQGDIFKLQEKRGDIRGRKQEIPATSFKVLALIKECRSLRLL